MAEGCRSALVHPLPGTQGLISSLIPELPYNLLINYFFVHVTVSAPPSQNPNHILIDPKDFKAVIWIYISLSSPLFNIELVVLESVISQEKEHK